MFLSRRGLDVQNLQGRMAEAVTGSDVRLRDLERRVAAAPDDAETRAALVRELHRAGRVDAAMHHHFSPLAEPGRALAQHAQRWSQGERGPAVTHGWRDALNQALDHGYALDDKLQSMLGAEPARTNHARYLRVRRQISNRVPRELFGPGAAGDQEHRAAIMRVWTFRGRNDPGGATGPGENYIGHGEHDIYGRGAVEALRHHGYEATAEREPGTRSMTRVQVAGSAGDNQEHERT